MERASFDKYVRDALAHLYDPMYLQTHPLGSLLVGGPGERARGQSLNRLLMETIESLRPPDGTPYGSIAWRKYRTLLLRYVEEMSPQQIADELGTSGRQVRRDHIEAVHAVVSRLWDIYQARRASERGGGLPSPWTANDVQRDDDVLIETELARLSALPPDVDEDVSGTVESAITTVVALAENRGVRISNQVRADMPPLAVRRVIIRQALVNTLLAAIDHASGGCIEVTASWSKGGAAITVRAEATVDGRQRCRGRTSLSDDDRLATVAQLLRTNGGNVEIVSAPVGVEVVLTFSSNTAETIVAIEDNPDMLRLLRRYLLAGGYRMVQSLTAASALECIRREQPVAVILDVMMPLQDGWEILQALKTHPETQAVPVIVCSVLKERELALTLGATEFLAKPVTQQELLAALARCRGLPQRGS